MTKENLLKQLVEKDVFIENPCNGKGTCGKCKVKIISGEVSKPTETEKKFLKEDELAEGIRLACLTDASHGTIIEVIHKEKKHEVLTDGYLPNFHRDYRENGYGIAIDIGTTTVVTALIDMKNGHELANASMINAQKRYGLDVLTRITYEYENLDNGIYHLQSAIVGSINDMIDEICQKANIIPCNIVEIDVAANSTMMHMLLGIDAKSLGHAPYKPQFVKAKDLLAKDIGIVAGEYTRLYCLPSVSAYIGADIVAGVYVCGLKKEEGNVLFIDIGTNGEIVLASNGRLITCSCAAGPALEGMNISCGMRASVGAIEDVQITETGIELKTIGNQPAIGLCGSGILAVVKELICTGIVTKNGAFIKKEKLSPDNYIYNNIRLNGSKREFILQQNPEILITQGDVRQVQLAKGAILSGFITLLNEVKIDMCDLDKVLIAGQFGSHLPITSLTGTGVLPKSVEDKIIYVGNTSKTGAYMALMSENIKREMEKLSSDMEYIELVETENYEKTFASSMIFP